MTSKRTILAGASTVAAIAGFNAFGNQANADEVKIEDGSKQEVKQNDSSNKQQVSDKTYTVKKGDTFWKIAKDHNMNLQKLMEMNKDQEATGLKIGSVIKLSDEGNHIQAKPVVSDTYTVKSGDTLFKIAKANNVSLKNLMELNNKTGNAIIYVGEKLKLKGEVKPTSTKIIRTTTTTTANQGGNVQQGTANHAGQQASPAYAGTSEGINLNATSGSVSVNQLAAYMSHRTGGSQATWARIINIESKGNISISNPSSGAYGAFQLLGHGEHAGMTLGQQVNMAASLYSQSGFQPWLAFE